MRGRVGRERFGILGLCNLRRGIACAAGTEKKKEKPTLSTRRSSFLGTLNTRWSPDTHAPHVTCNVKSDRYTCQVVSAGNDLVHLVCGNLRWYRTEQRRILNVHGTHDYPFSHDSEAVECLQHNCLQLKPMSDPLFGHF